MLCRVPVHSMPWDPCIHSPLQVMTFIRGYSGRRLFGLVLGLELQGFEGDFAALPGFHLGFDGEHGWQTVCVVSQLVDVLVVTGDFHDFVAYAVVVVCFCRSVCPQGAAFVAVDVVAGGADDHQVQVVFHVFCPLVLVWVLLGCVVRLSRGFTVFQCLSWCCLGVGR